MTVLPIYLSDFPNMNSHFPFHLSINTINRSFPSHRHDFLEFSLVIDGKGKEIVNGKEHQMEKGTFTFISPYQIHEIHAEPGSTLKLFNCSFDLSLLFETSLTDSGLSVNLLGGDDQTEVPSFIQLGKSDFLKFEVQLREILREYQGMEEARTLLIRAKLIELLVWFIRLRKTKIPPHYKNALPQRTGVIWQVVHYIQTHYQDAISLSDLAKLFNVSAPYLSEQFKQHMGESFVNFLHEVRLRHACSLLISTDLPVTTISHEVGYNSFKTFSRAFRQFKAQTPSKYRAIYQGKSEKL